MSRYTHTYTFQEHHRDIIGYTIWKSCKFQASNYFVFTWNMPWLLSIRAVPEPVESHTIPTTQPPNQPTSTNKSNPVTQESHVRQWDLTSRASWMLLSKTGQGTCGPEVSQYEYLWTWNPNGPWFYWKRPCLGRGWPSKIGVIWALGMYCIPHTMYFLITGSLHISTWTCSGDVYISS